MVESYITCSQSFRLRHVCDQLQLGETSAGSAGWRKASSEVKRMPVTSLRHSITQFASRSAVPLLFLSPARRLHLAHHPLRAVTGSHKSAWPCRRGWTSSRKSASRSWPGPHNRCCAAGSPAAPSQQNGFHALCYAAPHLLSARCRDQQNHDRVSLPSSTGHTCNCAGAAVGSTVTARR